MIPSARVGAAPPTGFARVRSAAPTVLRVGLGVAGGGCLGGGERLVWGRQAQPGPAHRPTSLPWRSGCGAEAGRAWRGAGWLAVTAG